MGRVYTEKSRRVAMKCASSVWNYRCPRTQVLVQKYGEDSKYARFIVDGVFAIFADSGSAVKME